MFPIRLVGRRDASDHALAEDRGPFAPWHQAIGSRRITFGAGDDIIDAIAIEITVNIGPSSWPAQRDAAAAIAVGEAFDSDNTKGRRMVLAMLRIDQRVVQSLAGSWTRIAILAGATGDADVQRRCGG